MYMYLAVLASVLPCLICKGVLLVLACRCRGATHAGLRYMANNSFCGLCQRLPGACTRFNTPGSSADLGKRNWCLAIQEKCFKAGLVRMKHGVLPCSGSASRWLVIKAQPGRGPRGPPQYRVRSTLWLLRSQGAMQKVSERELFSGALTAPAQGPRRRLGST